MKCVLSIAGSDSSGGAGIQADLKTMITNGVFGMTAITALTAQNTTGVADVMNVTPEFLAEQIDAVFEDIHPDAVKIGMVSEPDLVATIVQRLQYYKAQNIVVDPVMVATSGSSLAKDSTVVMMREQLLPIATVITPNIPESEVLAGINIKSEVDMEHAAKKIGDELGCSVLCKGGHRVNDANDLLYDHGKFTWFKGERIDNPNTHGTGCTLSSAIASNLAKGQDLVNAIRLAKEYLSRALDQQLNLGHGSGPVDHAFDLKGKFSR
ncbi:hydroxymethylpyrimidine/phosphomethylpyrimidine kinase [Lactobacillus colini]|uniref:Hydroxymethylpyrimidine/phosphomethylpyrimidine kinase n=1 Tax=Lactobacillus colini TaxID=1819254 RepID=A0ABS4MGE5_9LACO|nr:bifunctional hydroxymethylpyrimidine kinase/phosphomethylpyrimidine kinase [Lactobacillus colini]MBP2058760.1 hydroxymethylpyrimidine/phosphomethylpyrimidine kinase [Lactobacillus colini]